MRWSAVPVVAPPEPQPGAPADAPPGAPVPAVEAPEAAPSAEQLAGAAGAAQAVLLVWRLGAAAVAELAASLERDQSMPMVVTAAKAAAAAWDNKTVTATIAGAAERCALKYGLTFGGAPPDELVVGGALLVPIAVMAANGVRARRKPRDVTPDVTQPSRAPASPASPAKSQDWSGYGDIPAAGAVPS